MTAERSFPRPSGRRLTKEFRPLSKEQWFGHRLVFILTCAIVAFDTYAQDVRVFRAESAVASHPDGTVVIPPGSKLLSGGARANWSMNGSLLTRLQPEGTIPDRWAASAKDHIVADPVNLTVFAIALNDAEDAWEVRVWQATSSEDSQPSARASVPPGWAMTGGGCALNANSNPSAAGNLLTASYPASTTAWECRAKDHGIASPASITAFVMGIRPKAAGAPVPTVQITSAQSPVEAHPSAVAPVAEGFVITGGGARAFPAAAGGAGQLLTASAPELPAGAPTPTGWRGASKDHAFASPGIIEVFAVNLRFPAPPKPAIAAIPGKDGETLSYSFTITGTAQSPFVVDLTWNPVATAVGYAVERDGSPLAQLPASARTYRDSTLTPGSRRTYRVVALKAVVIQPGGAAPPAESALADVATPEIRAPDALTVSGTSKRSVDVQWRPVAGASTYIIDRNGTTWRVGSAQGRFVDTSLPVEVVTYRMRTLYVRPDGTEVTSDLTQPVTLYLRPFRVLAAGDSIMWGQGLQDGSKFTRKVEQWLRAQLNRPVELTVLARSGAIIGKNDDARTESGPVHGEVPSDLPLIRAQALVFGPGRLGDVDLLLLDGCINDVGVKTLLDFTRSDDEIVSLTAERCKRMEDLLTKIGKAAAYRNSKVVVTGYFPIASARSNLRELTLLAAHLGAAIAPAVAPFVAAVPGIPVIPDPILGAIGGAIAMEQVKAKLVSHSAIFHAVSTATLHSAVLGADQVAGGGTFRFAPLPFGPENAFAAPDSWLYLVPLTAGLRDEVYTEREQACASVSDLAERTQCNLASMGHPNPRGAQAYADAIIRELRAFVPAWRAAFATSQSVP